jgi:hypothetical protein
MFDVDLIVLKRVVVYIRREIGAVRKTFSRSLLRALVRV